MRCCVLPFQMCVHVCLFAHASDYISDEIWICSEKLKLINGVIRICIFITLITASIPLGAVYRTYRCLYGSFFMVDLMSHWKFIKPSAKVLCELLMTHPLSHDNYTHFYRKFNGLVIGLLHLLSCNLSNFSLWTDQSEKVFFFESKVIKNVETKWIIYKISAL